MATETEVKDQKESKRDLQVTVIYNGLTKPVEFRHGERVKQLLERAVQVFSPLPQPHVLSLFDEAGAELQDGEVVDQAGIRPGDKLLLRPSVVKGG